MKTWKKILLTASVCLVSGIIIGVGSILMYQHKQADKLKSATDVVHLDGDKGKISHSNFKNKKDTIEFTTESKGKEKIKTIIKKDAFCPKMYKNGFGVLAYIGFGTHGGDIYPTLSFSCNYIRYLNRRFFVTTGIKVDTDIKRVDGFQVFVGGGVNF